MPSTAFKLSSGLQSSLTLVPRALNSRPSSDVWSILEYVGHVEFIYSKIVELCESMKDEHPAVDGVDQDEYAVTARFNEVAATEMSARIRAGAARVGAALELLDGTALEENVTFNGNPVPLRLMMIAMVHESHHHLRDVDELLAA